jgi:serine/threonine protein kinase
MTPDDDKTRTYVPLTNGTMVSHYRIVEKIGAGGMGEVYLAEDTKLDRKVALKFLPQHLCQDADCRARFTREAQASAKLDHPNIVAVHEVGEFQGRPFFSMQHVEGQTLKEVIAGKPLPLDRILEISIQVCDGLQAAHEKGITHRDIKPSNILIDSHGRARIVDFGLASVLGLDHLTKTGSTLGTIGYMSPEQVRGDKVDHRTDLFSFGVVLYELITGHSPFKADSEAATLHAITNDKPEMLARFRREVPTEWQTVIDKALDKNVATRYQHADDIATDFKRLSTAANSPRTPRRGLWSRYVVTAAVAVVLIVAGYWGATKFQTKEVQKIEPARKMLAVLPFENLSPDPDQEYFSDGLTEELTSRLSLIQSLCVISRSSSMTFKGSNKTIPEITRALGVQYIVEGSVRKSGNELRITAQLIDANADAHIWSRSYTGTLADVFDMQDSVSQSIVDGIKIQLTPDETRRVKKRGVDDVDAYVLYLKGVNGIYEGTADALRKGLRSLEQSQAIIGDNALLYSGMAWGLYMLVNNGLGQEEDIAACEEYAKKALTLDPELPEAHAMLGWINSSFLGNQAQAVQHFKTALILDPNSENALWGLAVVYFMNVGRVSEALALSEKYLLLNPQDSLQLYIQRGDVQFYAGDFPQALVWLRKSHLAGNRQPIDILMYAMAFAACDSVEEAIVVLNEANRTDSSSAIADFDQVLLFALRNDLSSALGALSSELQRTCRRDAGWSYTLGAVLAKAGGTEEALAWMENGVSRGFINYPFMQKDPFLNNLRSDDRFKRLMERVKYEWEHFEA